MCRGRGARFPAPTASGLIACAQCYMASAEAVPKGRAPGLLTNRFGKGRVVYLPGRQDASYSLWADKEFVHLVRSAVQWVSDSSVPVQVSAEGGTVGVTCFDQPSRNRRLVHLVAYNVEWAQAFEGMPTLHGVRLRLTVPDGKRLASVRAVLAEQTLTTTGETPRLEVMVPQLDEYEIIEVTWDGD